MDPIIILILFSLIILFGALGEFFFRKTGVPDVIWLMLFGYLIANFFGFNNNSSAMQSIIPIFVILTLIIILFDGGLNLKLGSVVKNSAAGAGMAILYFILATGLITGITYLLYLVGVFPGWDIWFGIILGAILGGTSSVIVMPLVNLANLGPKFQNLLSVESAFNDALCIVVVLTIINYLQKAAYESLTIIFKNIAASFAIGIVFGVIIGLIWIYFLKKLSHTKGFSDYFYVLTLSLIILLYVITDYLGGSAAIAIFIFGLVLGSGELLNKIFKTRFYTLDEEILVINKQIAFLIKSFFFVLIGMLFVFVLKSFWVALLITILLIGVRFLVINIMPTRKFLKKEKYLLYFFTPKGLAAGILAISVASSGAIKNAKLFSNIVFSGIILSIIFATVALFIYKQYNKKQSLLRKENKGKILQETNNKLKNTNSIPVIRN